MVYWNAIVTEYQEFYLKHPKTSELASGILKIIPALEGASRPYGLIPGISLATLFVEVPHKTHRIYVFYDQDFYTFSILNVANDHVGAETKVQVENVAATFSEYINKLLAEFS